MPELGADASAVAVLMRSEQKWAPSDSKIMRQELGCGGGGVGGAELVVVRAQSEVRPFRAIARLLPCKRLLLPLPPPPPPPLTQ
eukprot:COSAG01_NODE_477_length_16509_cov_38.684217_20_plen_84_part_00